MVIKEFKNKDYSKKILVVIILIAALVYAYYLNKEAIGLNKLLKKENVVTSVITRKVQNDKDKIKSRQHVNITSDGVLYVFEDNNSDNNLKYKFLSQYKIDKNKIELLVFELNNIMIVSPDDKKKDDINTEYVEISLNGYSKRVLYKKDFYSILKRYNIDIEGEKQ